MKKIFMALMMLVPMVTSAYDFESDGIAYTILSVQDKTVSVSGLTSGGDIVIPDKVLINDFWFDVVSLDDLFGQFQGGTPKNSSIKFNSIISANGLMLYGCNTSCYYVDDSNPYMKAVDGVLYSKDMSRIISFPMNKYCEEFVFPESVTSLDDYSFGANKYIIRLVFNDNIEELPEYFLYGIKYSGRIKYLKLSNKIKVIHGRCLYDIPFLEEIILPKDLEEVEKDPDWGYYGLPTGLTDVTIFNSKIANYVYKLNPTLHIFSRFEKLKNFHVKDSNPIAIDENVFSEGQYFTIKLYVPKGTKEIYKSLNGWKNFNNIIEEDGEFTKIVIGADRMATLCLLADVDFSTLNLKAYIGSGFNRQTGVLTLTRVYDVPAGEGLLLKGEPGTYFVPYSKSYSVYSNLLKGVTTATNLTATEGNYVNYVLSSGSQGVGFYKVGSAGASLEAGRAYLQIPAETAESRGVLSLRFDDEATDVDASLVNSEERIVNNVLYDLQGRRVEKPQRGLYIRDGKKVVVK